ncbi:carbohydrate ABC transporter permease [Caldanaerobius polysaccharolyticus]|uniref:carbohydrate ABC transporter permease n=1 Tax=Caldanaerobius polysaccharolyticus TaxID=44256 RepID=UPI000AD48021|nr:sugar ABC transporter permease [Caldanaerobius polysaccharolyticus]
MFKSVLKKDNYGYLFIAPYFIAYFTFGLYPVLYSLYLSFTKWDGVSAIKFIGLGNYVNLLNDDVFLKSIGNTWIIWIFNVIPQMLLAIFLAVLLTQYSIKGTSIFRAIFYVPNLVTAASIGVLFNILLDWQTGTVNKLLISMGLLKDPINWLNEPVYARATVSLIQFWQWFGPTMIFFIAGIKAIPVELYEAAYVDGANRWRTFWTITLPLLRPVVLYQAITSLIGGMQIFDVPMTLTDGMGSPEKSILTMVMYLYNTAFKNYNYGYGAAVAYALFLMILVFSIIVFKIITRRSLYD